MRNQILVQAMRLFAAQGFEATSLQAIADAVGIRKPSLLYHYPSKAALYQAVLESIATYWNATLPRLLEATPAGPERLDTVMRAMVAFFTEDPDRARLVLREILDQPDAIQALIHGPMRIWVALVCDHIRQGQAEGRVYPDVDPEAYVIQVIDLVITGIATHASMGALLAPAAAADAPPPGAQLDRHIREILRVARRALFLPESLPMVT